MLDGTRYLETQESWTNDEAHEATRLAVARVASTLHAEVLELVRQERQGKHELCVPRGLGRGDPRFRQAGPPTQRDRRRDRPRGPPPGSRVAARERPPARPRVRGRGDLDLAVLPCRGDGRGSPPRTTDLGSRSTVRGDRPPQAVLASPDPVRREDGTHESCSPFTPESGARRNSVYVQRECCRWPSRGERAHATGGGLTLRRSTRRGWASCAWPGAPTAGQPRVNVRRPLPARPQPLPYSVHDQGLPRLACSPPGPEGSGLLQCECGSGSPRAPASGSRRPR